MIRILFSETIAASTMLARQALRAATSPETGCPEGPFGDGQDAQQPHGAVAFFDR
jgi:hypothetical protein